MSKFRVLIAEFQLETNTFSQDLASVEQYEKKYIKYGNDIIPFFTGTGSEIGAFIDAAKEDGISLIPAITAHCEPCGPATREIFNLVLKNVLDTYNENQPIDGILLALHGAMVLEDDPDGEGELTSEIRKAVGNLIPIVSSLDEHANITVNMVKNINAMFVFDNYPHDDIYERGYEAAKNMFRILRGEIKPTIRLKKLPVLCPLIETAKPPYRPFLDMAHLWEQDPRVISVSIVGGFPYADIYENGLTILAQTNDDPELAQRITDEIGAKIMEHFREFVKFTVPYELALQQAMEASEGPIVVADVSDNPGGGSPGDGTHLLRKMIEMKMKNAAFALFPDPETVEKAVCAGVGAKVNVSLGGKHRPEILGYPIKATGTVKTITDGTYVNKGPMKRSFVNDIGRTVVIDFDGIEVIVSEKRIQPWDPEIFRRMGIEPLDKNVLVVKSALHFRAAFGPLAREIIDADAPGLCQPDARTLDIKNIKRPIYPLDDLE